ncbi:MAG TPA: hypothetical protein VFZ90_01890 [Gemmatimonadales bacterium]|jgi:hypothetical protein
MMRSVARWAAIALLVALSILGLQSAIEELREATTLGQRADVAAQFGYALAGLVAAAALLRRRAWARGALWLWAGLVVLTGGMAPVVWGDTGLIVGLVAALACAGIAALVVWLATKERGQA